MRILFFFSLIILFSFQQLHAKPHRLTYVNLKNWFVYSLKSKGERLAFACVIQSKKTSFYLSYTGYEGWKITGYYKPHFRLTNGKMAARFYIDRNYVGTKTATVNARDKSIEVKLGLDTSILNPMFKGRRLVIKVQKKLFEVKLYGLKRAYHKSLECWRKRMGSVPYFDTAKQKESENKKNLVKQLDTLMALQTGAIVSELLFNELSSEDDKVYNKINHKEHQTDLFYKSDSIANDISLGFIKVKLLEGDQFNQDEIYKIMGHAVTGSLKNCPKMAVEKKDPKFLAGSVQFYSQVILCAVEDFSLTNYSWAFQTPKYILYMHLNIPEFLLERVTEDRVNMVAKNIAELLVKI